MPTSATAAGALASARALAPPPPRIRRAPRDSSPARQRRRPRRVIATRAAGFETDIGQAIGSIVRKEVTLNLPPGRVGLSGIRETFEYLQDPRGFIERRVEAYGPVFKTGFFFKPAIVFGSAEAIEEYKRFEGELPADEALPETFRELHTAYGALRQSGAQHKATRANFGKVLGRAALTHYAPIIARQTRDFVRGDLLASGTLQPGYECRQHCLRSLFELFLGAIPPEDTMMKMYDYNEGLLSLGKLTNEFEQGKAALETLTEFVLQTYRRVRASGELETDPRYFFLRQYSTATDENDELFPDDRVATTVVLMVWGAYIEAAASMGHCAWLLMRNPDAAAKVRAECKRVLSPDALASGNVPIETLMELKYTEACVKEALRTVPQTAGGLRINPTTRTLAGYDVPAGYVLTADPRIPFLDAKNYPEPEKFQPERFLPEGAAAGTVVNGETYFPGGMGQHQCPGISLSTLMTQTFLAYMTTTFDGWTPDLSGEGSEDPAYVQIPIVIIDDRYRLKLEKNWQFDTFDAK
jgi:cytochrome P450